MDRPSQHQDRQGAGAASRDAPGLARSSGDLVADRRYLYARAAFAQGEHAAAAELLEQTSILAPRWAPLWLALAAAHEKTGAASKARNAYARLAALDPEGEFGANLHLARLGAASPPASAPETYVRGLFDQYAERFETHLLERLGYRGPALLRAALLELGANRFRHAIDLGCGTGLCGAAFRRCCDRLTGVDLSPRMVALAREKAVYDRLETGAMARFLEGEAPQSADLVLAADVFVYVGNIASVLVAAERVLRPSGSIAFTVQQSPLPQGYGVGADMRFCHSEAFVREAVADAGLWLRRIEPAPARREAGADVPGLVVVAARF